MISDEEIKGYIDRAAKQALNAEKYLKNGQVQSSQAASLTCLALLATVFAKAATEDQ